MFKIPEEHGLSSVLTGHIPLKEAIVSTQIPMLYGLPSGPTPPNPVELLSSDRMREVLETLTREFKFIIIDTPPMVGISDPIILSSLSQKTILVLWAGKTSRKVVKESLDLLRKNGIKPMGIVLNRIGYRGTGYKKYYRYEEYGYGYGGYTRSYPPGH